MKSPRFGLREPTLRPIFDKANLRRAWLKNVKQAMREQFLPDPIDHLDIHQNLSKECLEIETLISTGAYVSNETKRFLQEKSKGLCRQIVILTVRDAIVLQCLSDALYRDIKDKEPTENAFFEPSDHHFSKSQDLLHKSEYGSYRAWLDFQAEIFRFSRNREYIVVTDIANYYDGINYAHLRNVISDIAPSVREPVLDMLIYVLSGLLWQPDYTPRVEIGLPQMNLDAPRILAHCFLYELDKYLSQSFGGDFVRFMDDIDIGVDSVADARAILRNIDLVLHTRHIRLNSGKTFIFHKDKALWHFRIPQNVLLDRIEARINDRVKSKISVSRERTSLSKSLNYIYRSEDSDKNFDFGSGEKILKRMLGIARKIGAVVNDEILFDILKRRPACRVAALSNISASALTRNRALLLLTISRNREIIDDATFIHLSYYLVETTVLSKLGFNSLLLATSSQMPDGFFGLYAHLWILSKYGPTNLLFESISKSIQQWRGDRWLGRLIGGMYPIFIGNKREADFRRMIQISDNPDALRVYNFHDDLRRNLDAFDRSFHYLRAPNPTKGTGISHSKYLLLLSALSNKAAPKSKIQQLINVHSRAWADVYYRSRAASVSKQVIPVGVAPTFPVP